MTDLLRIAHPQNCPPYGNSRVGICEIHRNSGKKRRFFFFFWGGESAIPPAHIWESFPQNMRFLGPSLDHDDGNGGVDDDDDVEDEDEEEDRGEGVLQQLQF